VKKVKGKLILVSVLTLLMFVSSLNLVSATTTNVDNENAGASCIIVAPGSNTWVRLAIAGQMHGNYYSGTADRIQIYVRTGGSDTAPTWKTVSAYEDNPTRCAFSAGLGVASEVEHLVKPWQIGVYKLCDTVVVYWTIPLVCLSTDAPNPTPAVTIPPGIIMFKGYGDIVSPAAVGPLNFGTAGWTIVYTQHYYFAEANFFCWDWHFKWEPLGQNIPESPYSTPRAVVDRVWTWTHA
jgi:hypothetical protein